MSKKNPKDVIQKKPAQNGSEIEEHRRTFLKRMAVVGVGVGMMGLDVRALFAQPQRAEPRRTPQPITIKELELRKKKLSKEEKADLEKLKVVPAEPERQGEWPTCKTASSKVFLPPD